MKKLTKKQQNIIANINDCLDTEYSVLRDYKDENNYTMVRHMQGSIQEHLSGISSYLIYSDGKSWQAVKELIWEMKRASELQLADALECTD